MLLYVPCEVLSVLQMSYAHPHLVVIAVLDYHASADGYFLSGLLKVVVRDASVSATHNVDGGNMV